MNLSLNKLARDQQKKVVIWIVVGVVAAIIIGSMFMSSSQHSNAAPKSVPDMTGVTSSEFTASESNSALENEEDQLETLKHQIAAMSKSMTSMQKSMQTNSSADKSTIQNLQQKIISLQNKSRVVRKSGGPTSSKYGDGEGQQMVQGIETTVFQYHKNISKKMKTPANDVPPGSFAKAVLLSGADTNAGVNGQTDTLPITLKILGRGVLPNGAHSSLKGCFVTAAAYGDASSERGQIRLQRLSCVRKGGRILDIPVEGTVTDMGGDTGVRGQVVMRNGRLIWNAGISGFLSGIGNAMQQSMSTQSTSPLGTTSTIPSGKVFQAGAFSGAGTALGKVADYYIKMADLYHPIVQIHAGSKVDVVFLKGFSLDPDQVVVESQNDSQTTTTNTLPQNLMSNLKNTHLGQAVSGE